MTLLNRIIGLALIAAAIAGLLFNLAGLIYIWRMKQPFTENLVSNVNLVANTLSTTSEALSVANLSLTTSINSMTALQDTISATAETIHTTTPVVDDLVTLMQNDLPETITSAQTSLVAAQDSAEIIDSVLRALTSIPFVSRDIYNPPVPLHIALGEVSNSLDDLPQRLDSMGDDLNTSGQNLEVVETNIDLIATNISGISTSLEDAQVVVSEYQIVVHDLETRLRRTETRLPGWLNTAAWVLTFVFIWLGLTQVGLLFQGMEMLGYHFPRDPD